MPKKKPAKKKAPKKAPKKRTKAKPEDHLRRAHRAVLRVLDEVTASDAEGIARLKRLVEHAHENARGTKRGGTR